MTLESVVLEGSMLELYSFLLPILELLMLMHILCFVRWKIEKEIGLEDLKK